MSSDRLIIVARNYETGEIRLPLGDLTMYDLSGAMDVISRCLKDFGPDWSLAIYEPLGGFLSGTKHTDHVP